MVVPAVVMAYKNRDNIVKLITYAFVGLTVLYALYKMFGAFKSVGEKIENAVKNIRESVKELEEYGLTKPVTPEDTAKIISKRASENPGEPYLVDKTIYDALKEQGYSFPANVKPYEPDYSKAERETSTIGSKLGLWTSREDRGSRVVPRYVSNEEYGKIQAKRWEALAKYYKKPEPEKHILPVHPRRTVFAR